MFVDPFDCAKPLDPVSIILAQTGKWHRFYRTVAHIAKATVPVPAASQVCFEYYVYVCGWNSQLLQSFDYDLGSLIMHSPNSTASYGSKSCPWDQFSLLLMHHLMNKMFFHNLLDGIDYPITDLDEEIREQELQLSLEK